VNEPTTAQIDLAEQILQNRLVDLLVAVLDQPAIAPALQTWVSGINLADAVTFKEDGQPRLDLAVVALLFTDLELARLRRDHGLSEQAAISEHEELRPLVLAEWRRTFAGEADYHSWLIETPTGDAEINPIKLALAACRSWLTRR
jgi:hypothetical protein